ncbi:asparagine synthase (glutamine-hydrolyzing) [Candidatus Gottesmanbacteria bacterium RIFCSPHIGHO2_02_FULL_40_24]|uniref:asparagine synthase (glutamine-hydrolyzing) n=1 Tax=Candidatus Gottesmanbacteria bacterium RIFCSPHIGHO2_01_FULL_40_15 TaxID=1798376 RepID=A0A1F5Z2Q1_9BACT|nr:MAG: asparagine synthase (glutamine-hydrolyzing) [Candidatus Gottesmanbacteria bacterium RIFCSPHIGHO2_01_FULL_40_15]OGG16176.1 MAG: asparagine synthase (glutamine-hydrolyzing) [Candidatus Gottesmanbacteria bacterium RIFCSPHIGHO2_02_FULL_40_24]OGG23177.1 MAG: asparagine synthase (glutamine-hydrolyzing) [Candidatus Gottesmanbacteria bacterium RIFCSPLOWO2_01_FULL_40_10]OGG25846.1 MAG: asparagine synthase (glutamine-hydrolyzing) [Candidatus Gottesmanbacteria bacterium RIFCSPHIGHO2_12_FULL_40_13]
MCGIAGIYYFNGKKADKKILDRMIQALIHRGPDDQGNKLHGNVGIANCRLAIIDLSKRGRQPMTDSTGNVSITYNGEIFNYQKLREKLLRSGYRFKSETDTEVILNGYLKWGEGIVSKLIGQFAFCIWDKNTNSLLLARDQLGINPLYYIQKGNFFLFASEIKALIASGLINREINPQAIHHFLSVFHIPQPMTIFQDIKSLLPGHYLKVSGNGLKSTCFWQIPLGGWKNNRLSKNEIKEKLRYQLISAVDAASVSDVPVSAFLSGGIDSSAVVSLLAQKSSYPIKTFCLYYQGDSYFDERHFARIVSRMYSTEHNEITVSNTEIKNELPKIIYFYDQPTGGSFETYFITKAAGKSTKVALSGLGGDELFAGYHSLIYKWKFLSSLYRKIPGPWLNFIHHSLERLPLKADLKHTITTADKFLRLSNPVKQRLFYYFVFNEAEKKKMYSAEYLSNKDNYETEKYFTDLADYVKEYSAVSQLYYMDLTSYTRDDLLLGMNMMSMCNSLEVRVPLLNPELVSFADSIPPHLKYQNGISKYIFKEVVREWLPEEVIYRKKKGFGLPRSKIMKQGLKKYIYNCLNSGIFIKRGYFNPSYIRSLTDTFFRDNSKRHLWSQDLQIWILFIFELWCRLYLDRKEVTVPSITLSDLVDL